MYYQLNARDNNYDKNSSFIATSLKESSVIESESIDVFDEEKKEKKEKQEIEKRINIVMKIGKFYIFGCFILFLISAFSPIESLKIPLMCFFGVQLIVLLPAIIIWSCIMQYLKSKHERESKNKHNLDNVHQFNYRYQQYEKL
jgi:hypothetical protein